MASRTTKKEDVVEYIFDKRLKLSDSKFGRKLHRWNYNSDAANKTAFPDVCILTKLADQAYEDEYELPKDWALLTTASNAALGNGYFGVAFWNSKLCQVVVAHRGTSNFGGILTCWKLIFNTSNIAQAQSAATFVYLVSQEVKMKNLYDGPRFQLSITGHSLGGWLAQITAVIVKYCKVEKGKFVKDKEYIANIHAHTVAIDNPGCKEEINKLLKYLGLSNKAYQGLDITTCLGKPNFVTTIKQHVGKIYILPLDTHKILDFIRYFDHRALITKKAENVSKSITTSKSMVFRNLGFLRYEFRAIKGNPQHNQDYSLNVFNERELCFVKAWADTVTNYPCVAQKIESKFSIPNFEVDFNKKLIKGNNLNKVVTCIRHIPSIETVTRKMLEECAQQDGHI